MIQKEAIKYLLLGMGSKLLHYETFEMEFKANELQKNLPDLPNLRDAYIVSFRFLTQETTPRTINNNIPVDILQIRDYFLTLVSYSSEEIIKNIPAFMLAVQFGLNNFLNTYDIPFLQINFVKSFIRRLTPTNNEFLNIQVTYLRKIEYEALFKDKR